MEHDAEDIDINDIVQGGIYDYLKNVSTWVMIESCSNYLNFLLYTPLYIANVNIIFKLADAISIWRGVRNWWNRSLPWGRYVPGRGKYITTCCFFSTYYSIHSNPCLTMVTLYECRRHHRSLHHLFGMDLPIVQK